MDGGATIRQDSSFYGPPLPPASPADRADAQARIAATPWGWAHIIARRNRWWRFVAANGGTGLREFARDDFLRDAGLVQRFDESEANR
jgi:hypothetical protein